jgi:hypothetical protein
MRLNWVSSYFTFRNSCVYHKAELTSTKLFDRTLSNSELRLSPAPYLPWHPWVTRHKQVHISLCCANCH